MFTPIISDFWYRKELYVPDPCSNKPTKGAFGKSKFCRADRRKRKKGKVKP